MDRGEAFGPLAVGGVLRPDRCAAGCWIAFPRGMGGLESELLPERRGVIFEEAASAGAGAAVCCSSGAALGVWLTRISDPHHSFGFANLPNVLLKSRAYGAKAAAAADPTAHAATE